MSAKTHLTRWQTILYASGSLATTLSYQSFATYIQFVYIDILGLNAQWVGWAWAIYGVWNAFNDPLSGYLSDKTRTRWGRRVPWIAAAFLPTALTFYLLWVPPQSLHAGTGVPLLLYFLIIVLLFDTLWTIVVMNWTSLFPEMIPTEKERATVSGWRQTFSLIGLLVGVSLPPILAGADWSGRGQMAALFAVVIAVFFGASLLGSKERRELQQSPPLPFWNALRTTFANADFRFFLAANLMIELIFMMLAAMVPFYVKYVLKVQGEVSVPGLGILDAETQTSLFLGVAFIVALPALPLWTKIAQRIGAKRALQLCCLVTSAILLYFFLPRDFYAGMIGTTLLGLSFAGLLLLPDLLIAAIADADELHTATRREGMYFGINGFIIRFAFSIQGIIVGYIFTTTGYVASTVGTLYPVQPDSAIFGMRLLLGGIPACAGILAAIFLQGYSLHGEKLRELQHRVQQRHQQLAASN